MTGPPTIILEESDDPILKQAICFNFSVSNNQTEDEALIARLQLAHELKVKKLCCYNDSQLIINHVKVSYQTKYPSLQKYLHMVKNLLERFDEFKINHVPREENDKADELSKTS
ncbi:hypothetical protein V8G54_025014 [Vigna mungo]|uniref:RNase H type-1 domain-containing protein n=1 Tax=Vigna mungo TaxID=3915 RepID=A0AAQ3N6N8_VIGMU